MTLLTNRFHRSRPWRVALMVTVLIAAAVSRPRAAATELFISEYIGAKTATLTGGPVANFVVGFSAFDACALPYTSTYQIQGSGATSPLAGTTVTTRGVVVGDYEGASPTLRGFYIQDVTGDGNALTSDGLFVFNGSSNSVSLGDVVVVVGTVGEFQDQTQVTASSVNGCGTATVAPVDVTLPVPSADFLEHYEGMLVRLPQPLVVTEHFQLGRFGEVVVRQGRGCVSRRTWWRRVPAPRRCRWRTTSISSSSMTG